MLTPTSSFALRRRCLLGGCVLLLGMGAAMAQPAATLSFSEAQTALLERSDQLAAAHSAVESARLRRQGTQGLGGPSVAVTGMAYRYSVNADLNLDPARRMLDGTLGMLPPELGQMLPGTPQLPSNVSLQREKNNASASLSLIWPLYMGGVSDAVRAGLDGATDEALADAASSRESLHSLLVQRYFGAQLAERAAQLRMRALDAVRQHDSAAQSMLKVGVIAKVERLQAQAALADAEQQARKARDDAQLAGTALARTVKAQAPVLPSSPLFVSSRPLAPLEAFVSAAQRLHPGLGKVQAKQRQAESLHDAQQALRRPQVLAFGSHELATSGKPNWVAGVAVRWTLWDSLDRDAMAASSQRKIEQAQSMQVQVRSDIALLVEKHWMGVEQARRQYLAQQAQEDLARELLRLRVAGLKEGTGTVLDLIDAQTNLAKVQTQRAESANLYVQALAALLESSGQSDAFARYMAQADIHIPADAP
ncbi:TolC family protein [Pantoea sp. 18069]|uniref:TolC family protein n=1 Tax=Pantoea sp. 18069 TaxID=2681415 RepID=UPI00135AD79D|nr:TolC family protein [Pantoea sp. 18069]